MADKRGNIIPNGDFQSGLPGSLPDGWELVSPYPEVAPVFELCSAEGRKRLKAQGNGNENCVGYLTAKVSLTGGKSYRMKTRFRISEGVDPNKNLLFSLYCQTTKDASPFNDGIFRFTKATGDWVEGENRFTLPGSGGLNGEVRLHFRLHACGKAWIEYMSLEECPPMSSRNVRVACTRGCSSLQEWGHALDFAGAGNVDIALLPESFYREFTHVPLLESIESFDGPSCRLMSEKAREHNMYVAGSFYHRDEADGAIYNCAALFSRSGSLLGRYYKNHLYSPELDMGVSPGTDVAVFHTDFGCIGMMICYDSWFTDVAELLTLQGAEIILLPNIGYYPSLMPARAADNCVRMVVSSADCRCGIWDTTGADILNPDADTFRFPNCNNAFSDIVQGSVDSIEILIATLDLSKSPSPHNWGGPMRSAPGGRRNRREQKRLLLDQIKAEIEHWDQ